MRAVIMTVVPFAGLLRRYRAEAGLTQEELAERANLSARTISDLERGIKQRPHPHTVRQLGQALGLDSEQADCFQRATLPAKGSADEWRQAPERVVPSVSLPFQPTPFIGRQHELEEVRAVLSRQSVRLLALTGPGGVGKTRLAVQVAADVAGLFPDGVWFVSLGSLADPGQVPASIASALGIREMRGPSILDDLTRYLRSKKLLLVLDNFEHLLPASGVVSHLLASCAQLTMLVTSRTVLHLAAEREYPLPPFTLPVPGHLPALAALARYDAIKLFVQRAEAVKPAFRLTDDNASAVAGICHRLDGLPLAIELAAARIRLFSPQALLERLSPRLSLLTGGARDLPARLQTVRAAIDWSYHLLSSREQTLFARLSVFAGDCTLEAVEQICNHAGDLEVDVVGDLTALVEQSLVHERGEEEPRFVMLETIREYARERLEETGEHEQLRQRHAEWYLVLAEEAALELRGPPQGTWLDRLEREHDNLRAALTWLADRGEVELGLRLAIALSRFWQIRGHLTEGRNWLTELLAAGGDTAPSLRAQALLRVGELIFAQARDREAAERFEQSLALYRDFGDWQGGAEALGRLADALLNLKDDVRAADLLTEHVRLGRQVGEQGLLAISLCRLARLAELHGDTARARMLGEESVPLLRELGDARATAHALQIIATAAYREGDVAQARAMSDEVIVLLRQSNLDEEDRAWGHHRLVSAARDRGDYAQATRLLEVVEARAREVGDRRNASFARRFLAVLAREQGDYDRARAFAEEALAMAQEGGDPWRIGRTLTSLGDVARDLGDPEEVIELCEQALMLFREADEPESWDACFALHSLGLANRYQGNYERAEALLEESLSLFRQGGRVELSSEVLTSLGLVALEQGQYVRAHQAFRESLMTARIWMLGTTLEGLAGVAVGQEHPERAARLFGAAEAVRTRMGTPIWPANQDLYRRHVSLTKEALGDHPFARACEEGRAMTAEQAIAHALDELPSRGIGPVPREPEVEASPQAIPATRCR